MDRKERTVVAVLLVCSAFVLLVDFAMLQSFWVSHTSRAFPTTPGVITLSELERHADSSYKMGSVVVAHVRYHYEVGGQPFDSERLDYHLGNVQQAKTDVASHPVGSKVQVFYDPALPSQAVLSPGIDGGDLTGVLALILGNAIMHGLSLGIARAMRGGASPRVAGGVGRVVTSGPRTSVTIAPPSPWMQCFLSLGVTSALSLAILGLVSGFNPSVPFALTLLAVVAILGALVYGGTRLSLGAGDYDLVVDTDTRTLALPRTLGRKKRVTVNLSEIDSVIVDTREGTSKNGEPSYAPLLQARGETHQLIDWRDKETAEAFTAWLREQLRPA